MAAGRWRQPRAARPGLGARSGGGGPGGLARVYFTSEAPTSDPEEQKYKNPQNRGQIASFSELFKLFGFCFVRTGLEVYLRACNTTFLIIFLF